MRVDKQESVIGELETYPALIKTSQYLLGMEDKECFFGAGGTYIPPLLPNRPPAKPVVTKSLSNSSRVY